jgi:transcriptional regulator with XRE-family HTH domain
MPEVLESYGARFRHCREASRLTQLELAEKVGLTRSSIANIEAGRQKSTIEDATRYAAALAVDPAWLAFGRVTIGQPGPPAPRQAVSTAELLACSDDLQRVAVEVARLAAKASAGAVNP